MKKILYLLLVVGLVFGVAGCGANNTASDSARIPFSQTIAHKKDYQEVVSKIEAAGFTNVKVEPIYDLITGFLTKDGSVEEIRVDGTADYSPDKKYPKDIEIIVAYHTFASNEVETSTTEKEKENETVTETSLKDLEKDLAKVLSSLDYDLFTEFSNKYRGEQIEFDGSIDYVSAHVVYNPFNGTESEAPDTKDFLLSAWDYSEDSQNGPTFKFDGALAGHFGGHAYAWPDFVTMGSNVHVVATVGEFNDDTGLFFLNPVSVTKR